MGREVKKLTEGTKIQLHRNKRIPQNLAEKGEIEKDPRKQE